MERHAATYPLVGLCRLGYRQSLLSRQLHAVQLFGMLLRFAD
jgi:hypothetical protein